MGSLVGHVVGIARTSRTSYAVASGIGGGGCGRVERIPCPRWKLPNHKTRRDTRWRAARDGGEAERSRFSWGAPFVVSYFDFVLSLIIDALGLGEFPGRSRAWQLE